MKFELFQAGAWKAQYPKCFTPVLVDHEWTWEDSRIHVLLEAATRSLGEMNAYIKMFPDIEYFARLFMVKEAIHSCRIEGVHLISLEEVLMPQDQVIAPRREAWHQVQNTVETMRRAAVELKNLPFNCQWLSGIYSQLYSDTSRTGQYRDGLGWVGGSGLSDAVFIPPHPDEVSDLMADLEKFWLDERIEVPFLIRSAISHYQFETIHPFVEGNGRIGRLMIPLYLNKYLFLERPLLFLSSFFDRNRTQYFDALNRVRSADDMIHWVRFFLTGIFDAAMRGRVVFQKIAQLRQEMEVVIGAMGRRHSSARELVSLLYRQPLVTAADITQNLEVSVPTANALIRDLQRNGILVQVAGVRRNRGFAFQKYLNFFIQTE